MSLFRLDASIRGVQSVSRQVADTAESAWLRVDPDGQVVRRDLAETPVPVDAWPLAVAGNWTPADQRTPEQLAARALAGTLADELVAADTYVFAAPLYNFGVSQHFKAWVDLVLTDPRFTSGQPSAIAGRPAALIVTRGGGYAPGTPREGWDHATGWYRRDPRRRHGPGPARERGRADPRRRQPGHGVAAAARRRVVEGRA